MFVIVFGSTNMERSVINSWIFYSTSNGFLVVTLINNYTLYFWPLELVKLCRTSGLIEHEQEWKQWVVLGRKQHIPHSSET